MLKTSSIYVAFQKKQNRVLIAVLILISIFTLILNTVLAAGELALGLTAVDTNGNPISSVQSGDIIEYIIDYSCGDLTDGCGDLTITFDLDLSLVELVEVITSPSYSNSYTAPTVTITNNPVTNPIFEGGESAQARVRVRVVDGLTGNETIPASVTGQVDNGVAEPEDTEVTVNTPDIPVDAPDEFWSIVKTQISPSGVAPAPNGLATYNLAFCPDETIGNISITNPILVDNFPAGAIVVNAGGGVVDNGASTITWTPPTLDDPLVPSAGCETVTYTLQFPAGTFPIGTAYTNTGSGDGDNPEIGATGICDDGCTNNTLSDNIAPPTSDFSDAVSKNGPGSTVIVAPGDSSGTSVFTWGLDLSASNVETNAGVTLTDILPPALDGVPATSVTNINSGAWGTAPDGSPINAIIEITTTLNPAWTQLPGALSGTNVLWSSAGGDFIGPGNGGAPNSTTDLVTGVRLIFTSPLPAGFSFSSAPSIRFIVREGMAASDYDIGGVPVNPVTYTNCVDADGTFDDAIGAPQMTSGSGCTSFLTSNDMTGFANITTSKSSDTNSIFPLEEIDFTLTVNLTEEASGDLVNPAIQDLLPAGLEFVSFTYTTPSAGAGDTVNEPYLIVTDVGGRDELLFYWDSAAPVAGSVTSGGATPTNPNPFTLVPPPTGNRTITIVVTARALLSAAAGPYTNTYSIASESPNMRCQGIGEGDDIDDIDADGLTAGDALCEASDGYSVREAAEMGSQKWIRSIDGVNGTFDFFRFNNLDTPSTACPIFNYDTATTPGTTLAPFTRYPCVAEGLPTENFEYLLRATNTGIVDIDDYVLYDIIPYIGDTGVSEFIQNQDRDTEFLAFLTDEIVVEFVTPSGFGGRTFTPATFEVQYSTSTNACRGEVANPPTTDTAWPASCVDDWAAPDVHAWNTVRAFRIRQNGGIVPSGGGELIFTAPMQINEYNPIAPSNPEDGAQTGEIAWNSFAQQFRNALSFTELLAAEPIKVGITVAQRYSVGNRVWIDDGGTTGVANDGRINGDEVGINDVTVQLWRDTGSGFALYATDVTRSNNDTGLDGYYFFGNLDGGSDIDYQVRIPGTEFDPTNGSSDLDSYVSSTGRQNALSNNDSDGRDTGRDPALTLGLDEYITNGVRTDTFTLTSNDEADSETDVNADDDGTDGSPPTNEGVLGYGENHEEDEDSDLTVDFGFYKPMSLGNRVWLDDGNDGAGGTNVAQRNDGIINGGEVGIENVVLRLYAGDGTTEIDNPFVAGTQSYDVTTDADGYYLFQGLIPGNYVVRVMPANFQFGATPADPDGPLADYISSNSALTAGTPAETPVDENGIEYLVSVNDLEDDRTDHGIDPATDGDQRVNGVYSAVISLTTDTETTSELPADKNADGDGLRVAENNSDLTVDFGFFQEADTNFGLGNFVWNDVNNDGIYDPDGLDNTPATIDDEVGIANVQMALFTVDAGGNPSTPVDDPGNPDNPYIVPTDANGYYVFSNLNPGRYIVQMTAANFNGGVLVEFISSTGNTGDTETDSNVNENGIDPSDVNANNSVTDEYQTNGVYSTPILLEPEGEPIGEPSNLPNPGAGSGGADDDNSDLTVDFGVYRPMSIGNIVWLDNGSTATGVSLAQYNDGIRNGNELGILGVTVQLFGDFDGDGTEDGTPRTATTDANGYYLFDGLTPGNYRVEIPTTNFAGAPLLNLVSSFDAVAPADADLDDDDHGIDVANPTANAVVSPTINLAYDSEPLETNTVAVGGDPDGSNNAVDGSNFRGNNGETDDNSDRTVDFGFVAPPMSIGNLVFIDDGGNGANPAQFDDGIFNGAEVGINGVTVNLYAAADTATVIASDLTDNGGYYLFDNLPPGDYVVSIPAGNFTGILADYVSSTDFTAPTDADPDLDDHGINPATVGNEVFSPTITLSTNGENQADDEAVTGLGANGETDNNSDLTVDFGFFIPLSIGNRVWLDDGAGGGIANDALINGGEDGIDGVIVELFRDAVSATPYRTTVTNSDTTSGLMGYYIFDDLPEGNYIVRLSPRNFIPDDGNPANGVEGILLTASGPYSSSETDDPPESGYLADNQTDNNDNGIDANFPQTDGIVSNIINLSYGNEPDGADDADLDSDVGEGTFGEQDFNAEMTIDFGVYTPSMSIGNQVFYDYNNDRILNGADRGVANVIVNLFRDDNNGAGGGPDGVPDSGINNPIATDTTDANGFYIFDGLQAGNYLVQIDETNFRLANSGVLQNYYSSQDKDGTNTPVVPVDNENDTIEDGVDNPFSLATNPDPQAMGVFSPTVLLEPSGEITTEVLGPEGDGEPNIQPSNSDLTVDFGFYQPMSIGNVVWFDTNEDGLKNNAEVGIAGVDVYLYRETVDAVFNGNETLVPVFNGAAYVNFDTTDANGFYLFDNLPAGQYWVQIDSGNFTASGDPLFNYISTQPENVANPAIAPAPSNDSNDNGTPNDATAITVGVTSELVTLGILDPVNGSGLYIPNGSEPLNEIDKSNNPPTPANTYDGPASIGRYGELDRNSDITIDFGFVLQDNATMSIGNRVWFDEDRSGLIESTNTLGNDEASTGIDGVTVLLYRANASGLPVGAPIAQDITANGGYYLFDVLDTDAGTGAGDGDGLGGPVTPGSYVVSIAPSNFTTGNILEGYTSTTTAVDNDGTVAPSTGVEAGYPAVQDDNNDNGTANATYGVLSNLVTLTLQAERADEEVANKEVGILDGTDSDMPPMPIATNNSDLTIDFGFYVPASIGNRVWIDSNNNGVFDTGELPVPDGVTLTLYRDTDNSTDYTAGGADVIVDNPNNSGNPYQVTTTNGYYLFENLFPFDDYIVVVDPANFAGGLLNGFTGSDNSATFEDDTDTDLNDNGRDAASYTPTTDGIPSGIIEITIGGEPLTEQGSANPTDGPNSRGNNGEMDANSNLTVDFGVFPSTYYSLGNRVWLDTGAGANTNNGVHDADEAGISSVIVNLYLDANTDGTPDSLTTVATTTTDANGYYLFDGLTEGNYIVSIAPQNFNTGGALLGYSVTAQPIGTEGDANNDVDHVSDHQSAVIDADFGIYSNTYNLSPAPIEPAGETDPTPAGAVQSPGLDPFGNPIPDTQSNLNVDFGFLQTMSLGNVVWFDLNNDGLKNNGETGLAGVEVQLYLDDGATSVGVFDPAEDTQIAVDTTDGNGYYLFNDLLPNDYFINVPNANWTAGATPPLAGMQSSDPDAPTPDTIDSNDNGTPNTVAPANGVTSSLITMTLNGAPTGETDLSNNTDDGTFFRGTSNPRDNNSDLTRDFGFFLTTPMSIGNRVWIDDGGKTGTANNGILDGDEAGIGTVVVQLYADTNGDGVPDTITPIDTTTTDANGYYLFDGLPPGQYVVVLAESNWTGGLLDGYLSTQNGTPDNDSQDNGVDNPNPGNGGIRSGTIVLAVGTEPSPTAATDDDEAVTGTGTNSETDEDSNLTVDFGLIVSYDWGDAPESYSTTNATNGPNHRIVADLYLGAGVDDEGDGQPVAAGADNNSPNGDGTDEDGMSVPTFVSGTTVDVDVTVFNDTGQPATLVGWFDWNGDGVFDASEAATANVPDGTDGVIQLTVIIPLTAEDDTGGNTYARLRLTNDALATSEPTGAKNSGEVEDYYIEVLDVGLLINKTDARNSIVAGTFNTYTVVIENSGADRTGVRFLDDIPLPIPTDATGYDPDTITWTCVATGGASCIATQPAGTGSNDGSFPANATSVTIDELIDLPTDGRVEYTITGRMNAQAGLIPLGGSGPVINTAELPNELPPLEDSDETEVIFDPPFGVKTGTVTGANTIRWTMTWYNPGAQQTGVTIGDNVVSPQQLPSTRAEIDLQCSGGGAGGANTGTCSIVGNRIEWNGTMETSTIANDAAAVRIAFNVTVPGPGTYNNTAILNSPSFPSISSTGTVAINEDNEQVAPPPSTNIDLLDPTIVKLVSPALALPGEDIVWTIIVRNPNAGNQLDNVSVTDDMPAEFEIISAATNLGTVATTGQTIDWQIGTLAPQQEVSLVVVTRLRNTVTIENPVIVNTAVLMTEARASAEVNVIGELPDTGEVPWWRTLLIIFWAVTGTFISLIAIVYVRYLLRRR